MLLGIHDDSIVLLVFLRIIQAIASGNGPLASNWRQLLLKLYKRGIGYRAACLSDKDFLNWVELSHSASAEAYNLTADARKALTMGLATYPQSAPLWRIWLEDRIRTHAQDTAERPEAVVEKDFRQAVRAVGVRQAEAGVLFQIYLDFLLTSNDGSAQDEARTHKDFAKALTQV